MAKATHRWAFKPGMRAGAYSWKSSSKAIERLKSASSEIRAVARVDPVTAAEGVIALAERIWPAFEHIDTSSGALGSAVRRTLEELLPVLIDAPADEKTRAKWLEQLRKAIEEDGVDYLAPIADCFGQIAAYPSLTKLHADRDLDMIEAAWSDHAHFIHVPTATLTLSCLLEAGRHDELLALLDQKKNRLWFDEKFGAEALLRQGREDEALARAKALLLDQRRQSAQSFFNAGKRLFIASCLYAIEKRRPTLGYAGELMAGGGDKKKTYTTIAEDTQIPIVSRTFLEMADVPEKTLGAYVSVIQGSGLELWNDPAVDRVTSASDFDFSTFRAKPQSLYIVVQPEHLKTLAPLVRLLFANAIASLQRREPGPDEPHAVMFLMDEFDQLGRQPLVLSSIKTIRSFGGRFFIISQTIPGLDDIYGETGRRSLQGGAGVQIYMTPQDDWTADVLSNALGRSTVTAVTESQSRIRALEDSANVSRRSEERPLISSSELLRFPLDEVLVLPEGQYPIRARHVRYYEDRWFAPIERATKNVVAPSPRFISQSEGKLEVALMRSLIANGDLADSLGKAAAAFTKLSQAAKSGPKSECRA